MSKVSRSVYQKVKEENKRLLIDIKILTGDISARRIQLVMKWRDFFRKEAEFNQMLKEICREEVLNNPGKYPEFLVNKAKENEKI